MAEHQGSIARHKTAMARASLSRPMSYALSDEVLVPGMTLFDYGCGRGDDLRSLASLGHEVAGWDPWHRPKAAKNPADIVNLGFVVNVIEDPGERADTLISAWALARRVLVVSGRLVWESRNLIGRRVGDGLITRSGTFQKFYEQQELSAWIEDVLGVQPVAAAPGIYYIFRDEGDQQQFLANRVYVYRPRVRIDPHAHYEANQALVSPLLAFATKHARPPRPGELRDDQAWAIKAEFGSVGRALNLIHRVTDDSYWERIRIQRRSELLVYAALSRFGRRPKFSQLPPTLQRDIRALFGTYRDVTVQGDQMLAATGNQTMVLMAARSSPVGKQTPSALYVYRDALAELPPVLQVYEGCARILAGSVPGANMVKLSVREAQVSFLSYPTFEQDAHPVLMSSVIVNLKNLTISWRDYAGSPNPPLLHRKEEFISQDSPRKGLYQRLTRAEFNAGLYEHPELIGNRNGWNGQLAAVKKEVRGHRLFAV